MSTAEFRPTEKAVIIQTIFANSLCEKNCYIVIQISLNGIPICEINNNPGLDQTTAGYRTGNK